MKHFHILTRRARTAVAIMIPLAYPFVELCAANKNVWIEAPVDTWESAKTMAVCLNEEVWFWAKTSWPAGSSTWWWSQATRNPNEDPTAVTSSASRVFLSAGGPINVSATYNGETSYPARVYVVALTLVNIDASDPNAANANYSLNPGLSGKAYFVKALNGNPYGDWQEKNVSANFSFTFNQDDLYDGTQLVCMFYATSVDSSSSCIGSVEDVAIDYAFAHDSEIVTAEFLGAGLKLYEHSLTESYRKVTYSVPYSGKTWKVIDSTAGLKVNQDPISAWAESHRFSFQQQWTGYTSEFQDPMYQYWRFKTMQHDFWVDQGPYQGLTSVNSLTWDTGQGLVPAWPIVNRETDVNME
jgi:hypothetical protein